MSCMVVVVWGLTLVSLQSRGRGGVLIFMRGCSRMTIDPRIPAMPGRSTSSFHQPGRHCLHQARSAVRSWASRMQGELHQGYGRSPISRCISQTVAPSGGVGPWGLKQTRLEESRVTQNQRVSRSPSQHASRRLHHVCIMRLRRRGNFLLSLYNNTKQTRVVY